MLQSIRNKTQGWLATVILGFVTVGFLMWGVEYYIEQNAGNQKTVAKVDGQKITDQEVNTVFQQLQRKQQQNSSSPLTDAQQQQLKQLALQQIIAKTALIR